MGIVGSDVYKNRPFWLNKPRYPLRDCSCGATQAEHDVYTIYVGPGHLPGFWVVKCRQCGKIVKGVTQEEATELWNGGEDNG